MWMQAYEEVTREVQPLLPSLFVPPAVHQMTLGQSHKARLVVDDSQCVTPTLVDEPMRAALCHCL